MSDSDATKTPAEEHHPARVGEEDRGHNVETAAGQPVDGLIADLADGDSFKHKHKHPKK